MHHCVHVRICACKKIDRPGARSCGLWLQPRSMIYVESKRGMLIGAGWELNGKLVYNYFGSSTGAAPHLLPFVMVRLFSCADPVEGLWNNEKGV